MARLLTARGLHSPFQFRSVSCVSAVQFRARPEWEAPHRAQASRRDVVLGVCCSTFWLTVANGAAEAVQIGEDAYRKAGAIKRIVKLFMQEEYKKLEAITSPDAFVYFQGPANLPYAGKYIGNDCVRQFMDCFNESFKITATPEVYQYVNESGSVFAAFDFVLKAKGNGTEYQTSMTMKIKVNDDLQLTKIAIISDTLAQFEALQG